MSTRIKYECVSVWAGERLEKREGMERVQIIGSVIIRWRVGVQCRKTVGRNLSHKK